MARENATKFEELLRTDNALQEKLQELMAAFAGDMADEAAVFAATIGKLAEEAGIPFSYEEGRSVVSGRELDDGELDAIAGGDGFCYLIGGSTEPELRCRDSEAIGYACAYIGISEGH